MSDHCSEHGKVGELHGHVCMIPDLDARIAELEDELRKAMAMADVWKANAAMLEDAVAIEKRLRATERDALRALLVEVEAYLVDDHLATDLLRRVREAGR